MNRQEIIAAIKEIAEGNGGKPPGVRLFESRTGVSEAQWFPHLWLRWSDALKDAGYTPNAFRARTSDQVVIEKYIALTRELGRFPLQGEIIRKSREDSDFPSERVFRKYGGKDEFLETVAKYCRDIGGFEDILKLCAERAVPAREPDNKVRTGFVYLMKSGRHYKIGHTKSMGRRSSELAIKIPVPPTTIHNIETDDPAGIESYWHQRFADKRGEGEWFELSPEDVRAFKRWKKIV